jgi:hypothetical protein
MAQPARPLRADAARNRARVLEVAYETFAAEGLSVPIDEIASRRKRRFLKRSSKIGCDASSTTGTRC